MSNMRKLTTSEAAQFVSAELGIKPGLSEMKVNTWLRTWPAEELPPVEGSRRRWSETHLERLRREVESRVGK